MQTVILAAGLGSRLKDLTTATPKALIEAAGRPLIAYALAFADASFGAALIVVGGFCYPEVAACVGELAPRARLIENCEFRKGNLVSMRTALPLLDREDGFLLMNTDHVYRPTIAAVVGAACRDATEVTAFCDFDRLLGTDDMKVRLDRGRRVAEMSKTLSAWDCGYVGMTCVPRRRVSDYLEVSEHVLAEYGEAVHVESILVELARRGAPPVIADISGHGWLEIDEPHERDHAEQVLRAECWWADSA